METDNSNIYSGFAYVYDSFMDNIPYKDWYNYIHGILLDYNIKDGIITELACGTGTISALLAEGGYDVTGVDISSEMLEVARSKCPDSVLLLQQDIRGLDLYGSSTAMV